jgi:predicted metal-binding protein
MKAGDVELREKPGATVLGCCVGEESGELLANEERSDALEMETKSVSVNRPGQNSMSSSRSKDRLVSNLVRKAVREAVSLSSFMLRTPRNWR